MFCKALCIVSVVVFSSIAPYSSAQTIAEYSSAASNEGCMAIPYSNWKENCVTHQSDVKLWCDGKGSRSCDESGLRDSAKLLEKIKNLETGIRERASQNKPDEARDLQNKKQEAENELASARKEVQRRLEINQQCVQHRVNVQKVFDAAGERVSSERSDSSKTAIHASLDQIKTRLSSGKGNHATEINEARKAEEFCKRQL